MIASAWFHVALFLERLVATFVDKSKCSGVLGSVLGVGIVVKKIFLENKEILKREIWLFKEKFKRNYEKFKKIKGLKNVWKF